ncbi:MAG: UDP-glucose/GDP-mannose dehydrogenase family protein [Polyangiaceae bacterium]|nr:UDP-glucose/GDP-mannose dehydrogenase family protein [Polyangiaceae bacterium]
MKIAVVGTGYVGLVAGACFAEAGTHVTCVDVDEAKLAKLRAGQVTFFEPGLEELVKRNWPQRLEFSSDLAASIRGRQAVFVAVGTPPSEDGSADLSHVLRVAEDVARLAEHEVVLVLKSTVPVGTNAKVREVVARHARHPVAVVSNPEFLKEGDAVNDFLKPDRVVIGSDDAHALEVLGRLYAPFTRQRNRIQTMSPKSAEIVKYAANALLATKISFMNEVARLCDAAGGDVEHVRSALGADTRIGYPFLYPGLGFGGSCFPKDTRAFVRTGEELGVPLRITEAAMLANAEPVRDMLRHLAEDLGGLSGKTIAVWGLAFKPRTDDVREAASLRLIAGLLAEGATVRATDPEALDTARDALARDGLAGRVELLGDQLATCAGADALVIATEWNEYRNPDFEALAGVMRGRAIFDGRNILPPETVTAAGFDYRGVGRPRFAAAAPAGPR